MNIYLVRHTTPDIELVYCYGQSDLDVKDTFPGEVKRIKKILPAFDNIKVFSSPLKRCLKLANALNLGEVQTDDRLKEISFGCWEMKKWKKINKRDLDFWLEDFVNRCAPEGESYRQLHDRMIHFFEETINHDYENVIIVSHGGALRTILAHIMEAPLQNLFRVNLDFGSVSRLCAQDGKIKIDYINR